MKIPRECHHRIRVYTSGKRVRQVVTPGGRIIESKTMISRAKNTRTGRKLARRRRRIRI